MEHREDAISLKDLFLELSRDVKEGQVRMETKLGHLHECFEKRDGEVQLTLADHKGRLDKHEHTFKLFNSALAIFGTITGIVVGVWNLMPWVDKSSGH